MENFKVLISNTEATYSLNEKEYDTFLSKNKMYKDGEFKYEIYNLTEAKTRRKNKMLDVVVYFCLIGASMLATLLYIQNY